MPASRAAALTAALFAAGGASATTYVLPPDELLADQAAVVVEGTVEAVSGVRDAARPLTEARVRVERQVKGRVAGGTIAVRFLGGETADGRRLHVWGGPSFRAGERVLLFLVPREDGAFAPLHFALGAFHEVARSERRLALRDLDEAQVLAPDGGAAADRARDFAGFSRWLADRAAGLVRAPDYFVDLAGGPTRVVEPFTFLGGEKHRWFQFDGGQSVGWRAHVAGQQGLAGGGFGEFQTAIAAWNNDPGSNVRYRYDGTTTADAGFEHGGFDGVNAILFDDPHQEIGGTFFCSTPGNGSGTLAVGGVWGGRLRDGARVVEGGDVITNDGVGCWFVTGKRAEQVFGHELGHTLGLGHSCGDAGEPCNSDLLRQALMRAQAHADDRGARLNDDDKAGIASLYPGTGGGGGGGGGGAKPAAPTGLAATAASSTAVNLAWTDNATNETGYRVERKTTGAFTQVLSLPANSTAASITGLTPSTNYTFRVRARNASGFSPYSNEAVAATQSAAPSAPSQLQAEVLSPTQVRLTWKDNSSNELNFRIDVATQQGGFTAIETPAANATSFVVGGLGPDFPYTFRIRAEAPPHVSAFSNEASVTIPSGGPCVATAQNLCLGGGRFRVMVHWRRADTGENGVATAVPNSDQTGLFWFFDASNIELIVKILDGRPINNAFWTFYGGLSDVQYWVSVTDVQTGDTATYRNPQGNFCGNADVGSFPQGSATAPAAVAPAAPAAPAAQTSPEFEALCTAGPDALCLFGGRFQVEVDWKIPDGSTGAGTPVPYGDTSGFFWFFNPSNVELVLKILDGRPLNGKFWVFYGALSNVEYDIKVTDTVTSTVKTYHNAQGNLCGQADTSAF